MGYANNRMMEMEELGLSSGVDACSCGDCFGDPAIAEFIMRNAQQKVCAYCGRTSNDAIACPLEEVAFMMAQVINEEWCDPTDELPYDKGFVGEVLHAIELLEAIGFEPRDEALLPDIASHFEGHEWCRRDYFALTPEERVKSGWQKFSTEVKHARRYTFWTSTDDEQPEDHPDYLPPAAMLGEIREVVNGLSLIREISVGTKVWRVQDHAVGEVLQLPNRFTSPPIEYAKQSNRMSPGGVPMFYGAESFDTAVLEVAGREVAPGREASGIAFESLRPFNILDLVEMRDNVSYFSVNGRMWRHRARFLQFFSHDVSRPIDRDDRQHIEYVPTQVFTEYVRYHMTTLEGSPVDGIRYQSSWDRRPCFVLFFDQDDCLRSRQGRPQSISGIDGSLRTESLDRRRN